MRPVEIGAAEIRHSGDKAGIGCSRTRGDGQLPGKGGMDMDQRGYQDAAAVLPLRLRREAMALPEDRQALA